MSYDRKKQECSCGNDTYHLNTLLGSPIVFVASCTECGRITGTVGDGGEYYAMDIELVKDNV